MKFLLLNIYLILYTNQTSSEDEFLEYEKLNNKMMEQLEDLEKSQPSNQKIDDNKRKEIMDQFQTMINDWDSYRQDINRMIQEEMENQKKEEVLTEQQKEKLQNNFNTELQINSFLLRVQKIIKDHQTQPQNENISKELTIDNLKEIIEEGKNIFGMNKQNSKQEINESDLKKSLESYQENNSDSFSDEENDRKIKKEKKYFQNQKKKRNIQALQDLCDKKQKKIDDTIDRIESLKQKIQEDKDYIKNIYEKEKIEKNWFSLIENKEILV